MIHLDRPLAGPPTITQPFGPVSDPNSSEPPGFVFADGSIDYYTSGPGAVRVDHAHCGVDYAAAMYTPVTAPADGTVTFAGQDQTGFGTCIKLDHGEVSTLYGHLSLIGVLLNQTVKKGQVIGRTGSTGNSTGPHLHWSVLRNSDGHYVAPYPYVAYQPPPPPPKPDPVTHVRFTVTVQLGDVNIRQGPTTKSPNLGQIAGGTVVQCDGWQRGEAIYDPTTHKPDTRWYHTQDGWIASAHTIGNAPNSTP